MAKIDKAGGQQSIHYYHTDVLSSPKWYTGKTEDNETGFIYLNARYYDPDITRFISPDPVQFTEKNPMNFNRYTYANNNPLKFVDPDGKEAEIIIWQPYGWTSSSFGHVSGNINGRNYSFGPHGWDTNLSAERYAERQVQFRSGMGIKLNFLGKQEREFESCLKNSSTDYRLFRNNCGSPFANCLSQVGSGIGKPIFPVKIGEALLGTSLFGGAREYHGPQRGFLENIMRQDLPDAPWAR